MIEEARKKVKAEKDVEARKKVKAEEEARKKKV